MSDIENDLILLRGLVARELETINSYRRLAADCEDTSTVEFIQHIIDEEKIHIADTLQAIAQIDTDQAGLLQRGFADGHRPGEVPDGIGARLPLSPERQLAVAHVDDVDRSSLRELPPGNTDATPISVRAGWGHEPGREIDHGISSAKIASLTVGSLRGVPQSE